MFIKDWKKEIWTIPNLLSLFRLLLIPIYIAIYLKATEISHYYLAAAILAVSCLTDLVDGKIARHFNMISTIGKILDPLADKATQLSLIICLSIRYPFLIALIILFVVKEGFQLIAGSLTLRKGRMLEGALISGKICTTILFISLILLVMLPDIPVYYVYGIAATDCVFMLIAFIRYIAAYCGEQSHIRDLY